MGMGRGRGGPRGGPPQEGVDGNWKCPSCANVNFVQRNACNRCGTPKPAAEALHAREMELMMGGGGGPVGGGGGMGRGGAPVEGVNGNWRCTSCSNVNWEQRDVCHRCQTAKPPPDVLMQRQMEVANATVMMAMQGKSPGKGPVEGIDGNWRCLNCQDVNWSQREECHRCKAPKSASAPHAMGAGLMGAGMMGAGMMGAIPPFVDPTTGQIYGMGLEAQMLAAAVPTSGAGGNTSGAAVTNATSSGGGEEELSELRTRCSTLEQQMLTIQTTLAPQVMQISAAMQQLQMLVTQIQSQMISNLGATAQLPASSEITSHAGEKRKASDSAGEDEAKRQA
ncbi:MAG: hypothetical protein SGPRY_014089 [Prymnesium sp.]